MDNAAYNLHRLRLECMDWCRSVNGGDTDRLNTHRNSISGDSEVWND